MTRYGNIIKHDKFFHTFLHCYNEGKKQGGGTWTRWKLWPTVGKLKDSYAKYTKNCNPTEHLAVDEITVPLKGRVTFKQYILKKHKSFASTFANFVILRVLLTTRLCI